MKKKVLLLILILISIFGLVGCIESSVDDKQEQATEQLMNEINNQIGLPNIKEFFEKKMAKEIFELRDNSKLITYAYTQNLNGKFVYLGKAIGFGLPYSVQYTNPERIEYSSVTLPQADPNGLFMPEGLSATWVMLINEETGKREVIYVEPNVLVTQSKLPKRLVESWSLPKNY